MTVTTLVAIRADTTERLTIGDLPLDLLRTLSDARQLTCPHCGGLLVLKAGDVRLHHFAHVNLDACDSADHEPETDSHRAGKFLLYQHFRGGATYAVLEQHLPATEQRADVFIEMPDTRYALEFQQANNTVDHWLERHRLYQSQGIADLWFLGQIRYRESQPLRAISPYDPLPVPRDVFGAGSGEFRVRELEKALLSVDPVLYYLDPESAQLTILLTRDVDHAHRHTLRAYKYEMPLRDCVLRAGRLWTPLDPLLDDYRRYIQERLR